LHRRAKIVAGHGDVDAERVEALRHLAELRWLERAPPATVNEHRERRIGMMITAGEKIVVLPRAVAIFDGELRTLAARLLAIGRRIAIPARENLGMLLHPAAIVVFLLVVDGHCASLERACENWSGLRNRSRTHLPAGLSALAPAKLPDGQVPCTNA